jgi:hypothetical protein
LRNPASGGLVAWRAPSPADFRAAAYGAQLAQPERLRWQNTELLKVALGEPAHMAETPLHGDINFHIALDLCRDHVAFVV